MRDSFYTDYDTLSAKGSTQGSINPEKLLVDAIAVRMVASKSDAVPHQMVKNFLIGKYPNASDSVLAMKTHIAVRLAKEKAREIQEKLIQDAYTASLNGSWHAAVSSNDTVLKTKSHDDAKTILDFSSFVGCVYDFVYRKRLFVFIVCPFILALCLLLVGYSIEGSKFWPNTSNNQKDFWGSLLFPFALSAMMYIVLYGDTGNHPAKGNENVFAGALMIVFVPLLAIAYGIYQLIRKGMNFSARKMDLANARETATLATRVQRLNKLFKAGAISKMDYDKQLSRIIESK